MTDVSAEVRSRDVSSLAKNIGPGWFVALVVVCGQMYFGHQITSSLVGIETEILGEVKAVHTLGEDMKDGLAESDRKSAERAEDIVEALQDNSKLLAVVCLNENGTQAHRDLCLSALGDDLTAALMAGGR